MARMRAPLALLLAIALLAVATGPRAETPPAQPAAPVVPKQPEMPAVPEQPEMPADPAASQRVWWVSPEGIALGPYSEAELIVLAGDGVLTLDTPVWREGMADWQLLGETLELASVNRAAQPGTDATEDANKEARHYLLGTWQGEGAHYVEGRRIYVTSRFDFRANGNFMAIESGLASGHGEQHNVVVLRGNWNVTATGESQIEVLLVHATEEGVAGEDGKQAKEEIWTLEIIDADTLRDTYYGWIFYRER